MVNKPLIRPYLLGGVALGGGTLGSHEYICIFLKYIIIYIYIYQKAVIYIYTKSPFDVFFWVDLNHSMGLFFFLNMGHVGPR